MGSRLGTGNDGMLATPPAKVKRRLGAVVGVVFVIAALAIALLWMQRLGDTNQDAERNPVDPMTDGTTNSEPASMGQSNLPAASPSRP